MAAQIRGGDDRRSAFGSALRYWRHDQRGMTQRALAAKLGISHSQLCRIEKGNAAAPRNVVTKADQVLGAGGALIEADRRGHGYPRPRQLPAAPGWLTGRDSELASLDNALADRGRDAPLLVAVEGPAGAGKTALALRWAHRVAAAFPDGQLHIDLKAAAPTEQRPDLATVLYEICQALGVDPADIPATLEARASMYRSLMAGTRRLVMLDNVDTADQVQHLLPGTAGCAVVVTSRRMLTTLAVSHNAHRVSVGVLNADDAGALLAHVIGTRAADEPDAVAELARLCGYLPLALRVAAELAVVRARSLTALAQEIAEEGLDALETDASTGPRALFSWTYRDLPGGDSGDTARVFRLLGLFPGRQITVSAIAALAGITQRQARMAVRNLRAVHLVDQPAPSDSAETTDVVAMHDLLHAYAAELAADTETAADRVAALHRLVLWTLHTARAAGQTIAPDSTTPLDMPTLPDGVEPLTFKAPAQALAWCDREQHRLLAVSRLAAEHGPPGAAWRLAVVLWDWLVIRRPWDLWRETHLLGIRAAVQEQDQSGEAWVRGHLAESLRRQGDLVGAREHSDRVLNISRETNDHHGRVWAIVGAAAIALDHGDLDRAQQLLDQSPLIQSPGSGELASEHGGGHVKARVSDTEAAASIQVVNAQIMASRGDTEAALALLGCINDRLPAGSAARRHHLLPALADAHLTRGDQLQAIDVLDRAAGAHAAIGDWRSEAAVRTRCGDLRARIADRFPEHDPIPDWTRARDAFASVGERHASAALDDKIVRHQQSHHYDDVAAARHQSQVDHEFRKSSEAQAC